MHFFNLFKSDYIVEDYQNINILKYYLKNIYFFNIWKIYINIYIYVLITIILFLSTLIAWLLHELEWDANTERIRRQDSTESS